MKVRCAILLAAGLACLGAVISSHAEDMPPGTPYDPDLPQPFDPAACLQLVKHSPFSRVVDYTDSLLLTGVAYVDGKPIATLMDKATKRNYVVSAEPNAQGWRLAEATMSNELHGTQVKLQVGDEVVTFRYSEAQLNPKGDPNKVKYPTPQEAIRKDADGKEYVRGSAYLSQADQDYYHKGMSKEAHDKFRDTIREHRDAMFKMTDEQRASFAKKIFDRVVSQDKGQPQDKAAAKR